MTNNNIMEYKKALDKARVFNNAGAIYFRADRTRIAWDLFKGALEVKLASERPKTCRQSQRAASEAYVKRAEYHVHNLHSIVQQSCCDEDLATTAYLSANAVLARTVDFLYDPYICKNAFIIPERDVSITDEEDIEGSPYERTASAMIIFNLALVDHMHNRSSVQAISLYELATTLLAGSCADEIGLALINNIGVWCYENGDISSAQRCMEHLCKVIGRSDVNVGIREREGFEANIQWIVYPPCSVSPAA